MQGFRSRALGALAVVVGIAVLPIGASAAANAVPGFTTIPSVTPDSATPNIDDGQVNAIVKIGDTVLLGGTFSSVTPARGGASIQRSNVLAYNATTGAITPFSPSLNAEVQDLEAGPEPGTV